MPKPEREQESARSKPPSGGLDRLAAAMRNGLEIARSGGITERQPAPFEIAAEGEIFRLRHYFTERAFDEFREADIELTSGAARAPVLLVPPLMMSADVWDVSPEASAVTTLHEGGADPWVVDFGSPEDEVGGLERTLTDHVVAVSEAVDAVQKETGQAVHLMGYSQGGMFAYQAAAYRRSEGIASLVTFGSGVDLHKALPAFVPPELVLDSIERFGKIQQALAPTGIPSWATRLGFQLMDPVKTVQQRIDFARRLYDREALQKRDGMRRFMGGEGWTAFPGPALADLVKQLVSQNRLMQGGLVINEQTVTLADITCPILAFVGQSDSIAPPNTVRAIYAAAPQAECYQIKVKTGHFGLVVGSRATNVTWPAVLEWLAWLKDSPPDPHARPASASRLLERPDKPKAAAGSDLAATASLAWELGVNAVGGAVRDLTDRVGILGRLAGNVAPQLPRLNRLAEIRSGTLVSPGLALRERAKDTPNATFFLFEGRAHTYEAADVRINNIVAGLIQCGVRHGQHVGLLMGTRPSAVAAAVALSRLGAVTVFLRADLPLAHQLEVAPVEHLLCDPENAERLEAPAGLPILVLGGGGDERTLSPDLIDMEAIDPDEVELPEWYTPNPGLAGELALIFITGDGDHGDHEDSARDRDDVDHGDRVGRIRVRRVSNRRWATSAYGTASGCALTSRDTVYCRSPIHHATGFLVCVGGTLVSGARLAMASEFGMNIEPESFWRDARRYGVNVVFYTGSLLRTLVNQPTVTQERHHSIRLFAGSGMPKGLWHRVTDRFSPASVVEFFATTEGNAVLVNLTGEKAGSLGRPLPGGGELRVAAWSLEAGRLEEHPSGFAGDCRQGEVGLLVERVDRERGALDARPLRGVFESGDAWLSTGDLVRVDEDGDYWLVDRVADVIHAAKGAVATVGVESVLTGAGHAIDLAAVYGLSLPGIEREFPAAALTLRPGAQFDPAELWRVARRHLRDFERPIVIRVMKDLPMTAGHRTRKRALRQAGLAFDSADAGEQTFWLAPDEEAYQPLSAANLGQLVDHLKTFDQNPSSA